MIKLHCFLLSEANPGVPSERFVTTFGGGLINLAKNTPKMTNARDKGTHTRSVNGSIRNKARGGS